MERSQRMGDEPAIQNDNETRPRRSAQQQAETLGAKKSQSETDADTAAQETRITDWAAF